MGHAGLGRGPPPKASTAVGHQTHAIGSVNAIYMYYNFLVSFVAETKLSATQGSPRTGQISLSTMPRAKIKTLTTTTHLFLNPCHVPTMLLPPPKFLWIQWSTQGARNMPTQTCTAINNHSFMFLWMCRLLWNFIIILYHGFLWVAE